MLPLQAPHSKYRQHALLPPPTSTSQTSKSLTVPSLLALCVEAVAQNFGTRPTLKGLGPGLEEAVLARLPSTLEPRLTMALVHDEKYWKRACEEGRGWLGVDVRSHGGSWKQAFAELFVSESLRTFGVYPTQPPGWDFGFLRPPMDARHAQWEKFHPNGPVARPDAVLPGVQGVGEGGAFMPWRERFCSNAQKNAELDDRISSSSDCGWPYMERLKSALRLKTMASFSGPPGDLKYSVAWSDVDKEAQLSRNKKAGGEGGAATATATATASAAAASDGVAALTHTLELLSKPATDREKERVTARVLGALHRDDEFDCGVLESGGGGSWPLREWVSPTVYSHWCQECEWGGGGKEERGKSVLVKRAGELTTLLANIGACEDHCFSVECVDPGGGCGLPSRLDLELPLSRLPNLTRLRVSYGGVNREWAPLPGVAPPFPEESTPLPNGEEPPTVSSTLTHSPDALLLGALPTDITSLCKCLRATSSLLHLDLSRSALTDAHLATLCAAWAGNATLLTLDLSYNRITGEGLGSLVKGFGGGSGPPISTLNLRCNALEGGATTAGSSGSSRSSSRSRSSSSSSSSSNVGALVVALLSPTRSPPLIHLDVSLNRLGDEVCSAILGGVAGNPHLQRLKMGGCGVGLGGVKAISRSLFSLGTALDTLDLSGSDWLTPLGGEGASTALIQATKVAVEECVAGLVKAVSGAGRVRALDIRPYPDTHALDQALKANALKHHPLIVQGKPKVGGGGR